jgi:hypothetical protein
MTWVATVSSVDSLPSYGESDLGQWLMTSVNPSSAARRT